MTKRNTREHYENIAAERELKVIKLEGYTTVQNSRISLLCLKCGTEFETSCNSFLSARKTGCPTCKKISISAHNKGRIVSKRKKKAKPLSPEFAHIKCSTSLIEFLVKNPNPYNTFILSCLKNTTSNNPQNLPIQNHHIIPRHCGGTNDSWNLVKVTTKEHYDAHLLRWQTYNDLADETALRGMQEPYNTQEMIAERVVLSHAVQRAKGLGRWNSEQQSKLGVKGGTKQTEAKKEKYKQKLSEEVKSLLEKGSTWYHKETKKQVTFGQGQLSLLTELLEQLILATEEGEHRKRIQCTHKTNVTSLLAKVIKKQRFSCYGWSLKV